MIKLFKCLLKYRGHQYMVVRDHVIEYKKCARCGYEKYEKIKDGVI